MDILNYEFNGEGMELIYKNKRWMVGIKNWKPSKDKTNINYLKRHQTDQLLVLLKGECLLVFANETEYGLKFESVKMHPFQVYQVPSGLWYNTVTRKDTKLILIGDSGTSEDNSDTVYLSMAQLEALSKLLLE